MCCWPRNRVITPWHLPYQVDDSVAFAREMRKRHAPSIPCISAGQSMGGLVATHLVLRGQDSWAGLILCSAAIDAEWNLVLRRAQRSAAQLCRRR